MSIWVYHLKKCEKNWGSPCWLRSGRPKYKLTSKLRKIIKDTKRYGVKGMNLSAHSNILGNIVNALEMILNNPRAVNFICQCFRGKNWSIPYLAVCGLMVIPELIWGRCTYMIFVKSSQNVYMGISFEKMRKKLGVTMLVKGTLWRTPFRSWKVYNTFQVWGLLLCIVKYLHHPAFLDGSLCTVAFFDL